MKKRKNKERKNGEAETKAAEDGRDESWLRVRSRTELKFWALFKKGVSRSRVP